MKKFLVKAFILFSFASINANNTYAQELDSAKNSFSVDLFRNLTRDDDIHRWLIQYERAINDKFSIIAAYESGQYEYYSTTSTSLSGGGTSVLEEYTVNGKMLLLEGRVYPFNQNRNAPRGFFFGTYFKHFWLKENLFLPSNEGFSKKHTVNAFGVDFGYQLFKKWFMIEPVLGFGGGADSGVGKDARVDTQMGAFEITNYTIRFAVNVGFCF